MEIEIPDLQDLEFIQECPSCGGVGTTYTFSKDKRSSTREKIKCYRCEGRKRLITEVGYKLLEFLREAGFPTLKHPCEP